MKGSRWLPRYQNLKMLIWMTSDVAFTPNARSKCWYSTRAQLSDTLDRMSLLDVGRACAQCSTIDFLPFTCSHCSLTFCREHVQTHGCSVTDTGFLEQGQAGPSTFKRKATCEVGGCERPSIEAIGGKEEEEIDDRGVRIAKEIRCLGCNGAFCTSYVHSQV